MSITLTDLPAAVQQYLDTQVSIRVSAVAPTQAGQEVLTPGDDGVFTVTATNAVAPDGLRLKDVTYHVAIADAKADEGDEPQVAKLVVPEATIGTAFSELNGTTPLTPGVHRRELFVRIADTVLDTGDSDTLTLHVHCLDQGDSKISCHVHADVDRDELFPNTRSATDARSLTVL